MNIEQAIKVLEQWEALCRHNDDGTDPDSHELLLAINIAIPTMRRAARQDRPEKLEQVD